MNSAGFWHICLRWCLNIWHTYTYMLHKVGQTESWHLLMVFCDSCFGINQTFDFVNIRNIDPLHKSKFEQFWKVENYQFQKYKRKLYLDVEWFLWVILPGHKFLDKFACFLFTFFLLEVLKCRPEQCNNINKDSLFASFKSMFCLFKKRRNK